jgi:hypothetical protein
MEYHTLYCRDMAKANCISLVTYAVLMDLQHSLCGVCGQLLDAPYDRPFRKGSVRVTNPDDYAAVLAHLLPDTRGGRKVIGNLILQHGACNDSYKNLDFAAVATADGFHFDYDASLAISLEAKRLGNILSRSLTVTESHLSIMRAELPRSTDWKRRYPKQATLAA